METRPLTIIEMLERARACLYARFGDRWHAPYAEGKAYMSDHVCGELLVPHETAVQMIEALEGNGSIRFVGVLGIKQSAPADGPLDLCAQSPLTPDTDTTDVRPEGVPKQPVLGDWVLRS